MYGLKGAYVHISSLHYPFTGVALLAYGDLGPRNLTCCFIFEAVPRFWLKLRIPWLRA